MKTITYNPETHVLVPREPSEEMIEAGDSIRHGRIKTSIIYMHMIAAAPQPEPNPNWCAGCSPDNCSGCGAEPVAYTTPQPDRVAELEQLRQRVTEKDEVIAEAGEMLAMRDRQLAALKAELREICAAIDDPACDLTLTTVECIKKLKAENEALRKDAERYQWLKSQEPSKADGYAIGYFDACGVDAWRMTTKDLDQAIDATMAQGEQG